VEFFQVLWTAFLIFLWVLWIWLVISVLIDIFRSDDLRGWGKAGWTVLVVFLTWIGVLIYLIARGEGMTKRRIGDEARVRRMQEDYIREVAGSAPTSSASPADELTKLDGLRKQGVLSEDEFAAQKAKILGG
jgi:hypothetical protein